MKFLKYGILFGATVIGSLAYTVSRIGNGFTSGDFTADFPRGTYESRSSESGRLTLLMAFPQLTSTVPMPQLITISDFVVEYPELASSSLNQIEEFLIKTQDSTWKKVDSSCYLMMSAVSQQSQTLILMWEKGRGVVIISPRSRFMESAVQDILKTARVKGKSCQN